MNWPWMSRVQKWCIARLNATMPTHVSTFLLFSTLLAGIVCIICNSSAVTGNSWRNMQIRMNHKTSEHYFVGFRQECRSVVNVTGVAGAANSITNRSEPVCLYHNGSDPAMAVFLKSSYLYQVGFVFQIVGTLFLGVVFLLSVFRDEFSRKWSLYLIFYSTIMTFYTLGLLIVVVSALFFVSVVKYRVVERTHRFYEITAHSFSFFNCVASIFFNLIVNGLVFFSLSFLSTASSLSSPPLSSASASASSSSSASSKALTSSSSVPSYATSFATAPVASQQQQSIIAPPPPPPPPAIDLNMIEMSHLSIPNNEALGGRCGGGGGPRSIDSSSSIGSNKGLAISTVLKPIGRQSKQRS